MSISEAEELVKAAGMDDLSAPLAISALTATDDAVIKAMNDVSRVALVVIRKLQSEVRAQVARIAELTHENQVLVENWDAQEMALLEIVTICGGNAEEARGRSEECYVSIVKTRIAELEAECRNAKEWQEEFSKAADGRYERIAELEASVRNQQGDNLCWFDGSPPIPPKAEFLESCRRYHDQIATQNGVLEGGRTIAQLEARVVELEAERLPLYSDRIANLEAERDALTDKAAHLYKLSELPFVSLGIVCEDRDRLKHSDRELRAENSALRKALEDAQAALGNIAYEVDAEERQPAAHTAFVAISPILRIPEAAATVHGAPKP